MAVTTDLQSLTDLDLIVDCDAHVTESQEDILPYINDPYASLFDRGSEGNLVGGLYASFYPKAGYLSPMATGKVDMASVNTPSDVVEGHIKKLGIDKVVLNPTLNLALPIVHHDDLSAALAEAYNMWLLDTFLDQGDPFYGLTVVSPQKPERAAEEIDARAGENGIVGVSLPGSAVFPPLGAAVYDPIYEACHRHNLPLVIHNGVTGSMVGYSQVFRGTTRFLEIHASAHPMQHMIHISSLLTHGVPERFPDLNFVLQEAGIGWFPYFMHRYEEEYSKERHDAPLLQKPPSEYLQDQFYVTSQPVEGIDDPGYIKHTIEAFNGQTNLMFSSDYPHYDFDTAESFFNILNRSFDDQAVRSIFGETATEVFRF